MISIDSEKCIRCGLCSSDCLGHVITFEKKSLPFVKPDDEKFCIDCQHCLAICPTGALTFRSIDPKYCSPIGAVPQPEEMLNLIRQRRSVRQYKKENVSSEILDKLKETLAWMPTGCNDHRLFFNVVEERSEMDLFRKEMNRIIRFLIKSGILRLLFPGYKRLKDKLLGGMDVVFRDAPHMLVVATPKKAPCAEADPWIAASYFDLYAQSFGLGTCWCGFAVHAFKRSRKMRNRLNLPKGYKVGAVLLFGTPSIKYARATQPSKMEIKTLP